VKGREGKGGKKRGEGRGLNERQERVAALSFAKPRAGSVGQVVHTRASDVTKQFKLLVVKGCDIPCGWEVDRRQPCVGNRG